MRGGGLALRLLTVEVAIFASTWSQRVEERNLFYLAPLLLIALMAWIERGQPRPARAAVAAAGVAAALPGVIPFLKLMNINAQSDTPFLLPWWWLGDGPVGRPNVALVAVTVSIGLGAAFLWLPRALRAGPPGARRARLLPHLAAARALEPLVPANLSRAAYTTGIGGSR